MSWKEIGFARRLVGRALVWMMLAVAQGAFVLPADATVLETVSVSSSYGYYADSAAPVSQLTTGGASERIYVPHSDDGAPSELGIVYNTTAANGGFYFLHQDYCVGTCSTFSQTIVTITLQNTGSSAVDLRFDSEITPGHIALNGPTAGTNGQFVFSVAQSVNGGEAASLYGATGSIVPDGPSLDTGGLSFNGEAYINPAMSNWAVIDWGATNLSVPLMEIASGATSVLTYTATYYVRNNAVCETLDTCSSAEIVFGDPRNDGSVVSRFSALSQLSALGTDASEPVVGGDYTAAFVPISIVPVDAPLPDDPAEKTQVSYDPVFTSHAVDNVPEPATWTMMLFGFAAIGATLRRPRGTAVT